MQKKLLVIALSISAATWSVCARAATDVTDLRVLPVNDRTININAPDGQVLIYQTGGALINADNSTAVTMIVHDTSAATEVFNGVGQAIVVTGGFNSPEIVTVSAGASVMSAAHNAIEMDTSGVTGPTSVLVTNAGSITTQGFNRHALVLSGTATGAGGVTVNNVSTGSITAGTGGYAIDAAGLTDAAVALTITTSGVVTGNIRSNNSAATSLLRINGGTITGNITPGGAGAINLTVGQSSPVTFSTGGTISLNAGTLTVGQNGTLFTAQHNITTSGAASFGANTTTHFLENSFLSGPKTITGSVRIVAGKSTGASAGGITFGATGIYRPVVQGANNTVGVANGTMPGGALSLPLGSQIIPELSGNGYFANGQAYVVIPGTSIVGTESSTLVQPGSATVSFLKSVVNNSVQLQVVRTPYNANALSPNVDAIGRILEGFGVNVTPSLGQVVGAMDTLGTQQDLNEALLRLAPDHSGASLSASYFLQKHSSGTIFDRLADLRNLPALQPQYAAGEFDLGRGAWVQVFGSRSGQKTMQDIVGYSARFYGIGVGTDVRIDNLVVGLSGSMGSAHTLSRHPNSNQININSHQAAIYASYGAFYGFDLDGMFAYTHNRYDSKRKIIAGPVQKTAVGLYGGGQYTARVLAGYPFEWRGNSVIPQAGFQYANLVIDRYLETGADSANLYVDGQHYTFFTPSIGAKLRRAFENSYGTIVPELRVMAYHSLSNEVPRTHATFTDNGSPMGPSFITQGLSGDKSLWDVGFSINLHREDTARLLLAYDLESKPSYASHLFSVTFRYEW